MRHFVLAFVCFSTLAMAQNVLAIAPVPVDAQMPVAHVMEAAEETARPAPVTEMPETSTVGLLVAGLAGLTAAGSRRESTRAGRRSVA